METKLGLVLIFGGLCFCQAVQGNEKEGYDTSHEKITDWKYSADRKGH